VEGTGVIETEKTNGGGLGIYGRRTEQLQNRGDVREKKKLRNLE